MSKALALVKVLAARDRLVKKLADRYGELTAQIEAIRIQREKVGLLLREDFDRLKKLGLPTRVDGEAYRIRLKPKQEINIDPCAFHKLCPPREFFDCIKVLTAKAQAAVGKATLDKITTRYDLDGALVVERVRAKPSLKIIK